jgi:biotin carboxylase
MSSVRKKILIVEPQSSGLALIDAVIDLNFEPIVLTANDGERQLPAEYKIKVGTTLVADTNNLYAVFERLEEFCQNESVCGVVCGFEYYVPLTAQIAERLHLPSIPVSAALAVRYKDIMRHALSRAGVSCPRYHVLKTADDLSTCLDEVVYPVVVKPTNMSGSIQVSKASSRHELIEAVHQIWDSNFVDMGLTPEKSVLVEQYIEGPEFSVEGYIDPVTKQTRVLSITKKFLGPEPYFVEMGHLVNAPIEGSVRLAIETYVGSVVEALGINMGPFHGELRLASDGSGPILMEIGARLAGDHLCELLEMATGTNLAKLAVNMAARVPLDHPQSIEGAAGIVFFVGQRKNSDLERIEEEIRQLSSCRRVDIDKRQKNPNMQATDFSSRTGFAMFSAKDSSVVGNEIESARKIWNHPRKHILIINRWDDEFASYHEHIDHSQVDVSYITTSNGAKCLSQNHAALEIVGDITDCSQVTKAVENVISHVGPIDQVMALSEFDLLTGAMIREEFSIPGPDVATVSAWRDKTVMKDVASKSGIPVPRWCEPTSKDEIMTFAAKVGWPIVLKPKAGAASEGVFVLSSYAELEETWSKISPDLSNVEVEEFIVGEIFHSDGLVKDCEVIFEQSSKYFNSCFEFSKGKPLGSIFVTDPQLKKQCFNFSASIVRALSVENGAFHIEFFRRSDGSLVFLEMGARVGGGEIPFVIRDILGVDLIGSWLKILGGQSPTIKKTQSPSRVGGFLMIPEPPDGTYEVIGTNSVRDSVRQVYQEILPPKGAVLDGKGGYEKISGRFHLAGASESELFGAITNILNNYVIQTITLS